MFKVGEIVEHVLTGELAIITKADDSCPSDIVYNVDCGFELGELFDISMICLKKFEGEKQNIVSNGKGVFNDEEPI